MGGGRWNSEGIPVVYASSSLALAALEYVVHVDIEDVPADLVALAIEVPSEVTVEEVEADRLPDDWNSILDHPECVARGDRWVEEGKTLLAPRSFRDRSGRVQLPHQPGASGRRPASGRFLPPLRIRPATPLRTRV